MEKQISLFKEVTHLSNDCFISGTPNIPDPYDSGWERYRYFNQLPEYRQQAVKEIAKPLLKLVLCEPVEEGWQYDNVIELFPPKEAA